jgi:hypothetical protein
MKVTTKWDKSMTHYIGRPSVFGNPYPMRNETNPETARKFVIDQFEAYARTNSVLLTCIRELPEDAVLGCYCSPLPCHGDVIIKIWKELHSDQTQQSPG